MNSHAEEGGGENPEEACAELRDDDIHANHNHNSHTSSLLNRHRLP